MDQAGREVRPPVGASDLSGVADIDRRAENVFGGRRPVGPIGDLDHLFDDRLVDRVVTQGVHMIINRTRDGLGFVPATAAATIDVHHRSVSPPGW
jgi:hypothetical protein